MFPWLLLASIDLVFCYINCSFLCDLPSLLVCPEAGKYLYLRCLNHFESVILCYTMSHPTQELRDAVQLNLSNSKSSPNVVNIMPPKDEIPSIITLNVGGQHFRTHKSTLEDAHYFRPYLEGRFTWIQEDDGSYFVDADPDIFAHVLRFLRRPSVYPLFWSKVNGFDYNLYNHLEDAATDFQIAKLEDWIKEKKYLKAISVQVDEPTVLTRLGGGHVLLQGDGDIMRNIVIRTRQVYDCPRGIPAHGVPRGDRSQCGQACNKARTSSESKYVNEEYADVVTTYKRVEVHDEVCFERNLTLPKVSTE